MHIAFYTPVWPASDFQNDVASYVSRMKSELEARGHRVTVLTSEISAEEIIRIKDKKQRTRHQRARGNLESIVLLKPSSFNWLASKIKVVFGQAQSTTRLGQSIAKVLRSSGYSYWIELIEIPGSHVWSTHLGKLDIATVVKLHKPAFLSIDANELRTPAAQRQIKAEEMALHEAPLITSANRADGEETVKYYNLQREIVHVANPGTQSGAADLNEAMRVYRKALHIGRSRTPPRNTNRRDLELSSLPLEDAMGTEPLSLDLRNEGKYRKLQIRFGFRDGDGGPEPSHDNMTFIGEIFNDSLLVEARFSNADLEKFGQALSVMHDESLFGHSETIWDDYHPSRSHAVLTVRLVTVDIVEVNFMLCSADGGLGTLLRLDRAQFPRIIAAFLGRWVIQT